MNEIRDDIKAYLDGELPPDRAAEVAAALENDPELKAEADFYRLLGRSISEHAKPIPVEGLDRAVNAAAKPRSIWRDWGYALAAVAVVAVIGGVFSVPRLSGSREGAAPMVAGTAAKEAPTPASSAPAGEATESLDMAGEAKAGVTINGATRGLLAESEASGAAPSRSRAPAASAPPPVLQNRQVIRNASIALRVGAVPEGRDAVERIAREFGGYVESSNMNFSDEGSDTASIVLKVDSRRFAEAISKIRTLGSVVSESSGSDDVTVQIVDMEARIRTLRSEEESLRQILREARRLGDVLNVRDRITEVRSEIDSITSQAKTLKNLAELATISVTLQSRPDPDKPKEEGWFDDVWANALRAFNSALKFLVGGFAYVLALSPIWLPVVFIIWLMWRKSRKP